MAGRTELTTLETVQESRSWLFTVRDRYGEAEEAILVPCEDGVEGWINRCMHEPQRLDVGRGVAMRDEEIICPRHGSMYDACSGACDNGEAAGTRLVGVDVSVEDGRVYLTDSIYHFDHEGGLEDGGDGGEDGTEDDGGSEGPSSTSHISF
ncbi:Rieske (2Fe-2S) protein [Natronosalvus caseinilyticus]|uniref:Rieske (2Fe-2S) protein n=1 Tax=Natronosalvus caseinilyticus TaxID=2953747 RepID=UPI0028A8540B|nr:Rieske 2Fe-2S domain-containing protein [Natronosalvus caseinilyticus]